MGQPGFCESTPSGISTNTGTGTEAGTDTGIDTGTGRKTGSSTNNSTNSSTSNTIVICPASDADPAIGINATTTGTEFEMDLSADPTVNYIVNCAVTCSVTNDTSTGTSIDTNPNPNSSTNMDSPTDNSTFTNVALGTNFGIGNSPNTAATSTNIDVDPGASCHVRSAKAIIDTSYQAKSTTWG